MNVMNNENRVFMSDQTPQAVQSCHKLLVWFVPLLDHFPRNRRFTLGEKIETSLLKVLEKLVKASYSKRKRYPLEEANNQLNIVIHLWRLCFELRVISKKRYGHGAGLLLELGKQIGGWRKYSEKSQ